MAYRILPINLYVPNILIQFGERGRWELLKCNFDEVWSSYLESNIMITRLVSGNSLEREKCNEVWDH